MTQCCYVFSRGLSKGERCDGDAVEGTHFCALCKNKATVKAHPEQFIRRFVTPETKPKPATNPELVVKGVPLKKRDIPRNLQKAYSDLVTSMLTPDPEPELETEPEPETEPERCHYIFVRGPHKGERCSHKAGDNGFCSSCATKKGVQKNPERFLNPKSAAGTSKEEDLLEKGKYVDIHDMCRDLDQNLSSLEKEISRICSQHSDHKFRKNLQEAGFPLPDDFYETSDKLSLVNTPLVITALALFIHEEDMYPAFEIYVPNGASRYRSFAIVLYQIAKDGWSKEFRDWLGGDPDTMSEDDIRDMMDMD